ncbi:MAG: restriction endonuclease subunit S, partial [Gammaproteobacteria bacterium]|nr:restriction endonuclease subunit S [Gammaproteobacteria bacterium]
IFYPIAQGKNKIKTKDILESGKVPVVDQGQSFIAGYTDEEYKTIKIPGPVIIFGDHTRAIKYVDFDFVVGADGVKILQPIGIFEKYFYLVLRSYDLKSRGYSRHYKILTSQYFPIAPLEEQKRIVAKVDQLMVLCDQLENQQKQKAKTHVAINNAVLDKLLTSQTPEEFNQHWQRIANNFRHLYYNLENLTKLRTGITQLAIQGKFVPRDPKDKSANYLLENAKKYKQSLIDCGKIRREKKEPEEGSDTPYFNIPAHWASVRLGEIIPVIRGASPRPKGDPKYFSTFRTPYHWIKISDIRKYSNGWILNDTDEFLTEEGAKKSVIVEKGTFLLTNSATIGVPIVVGMEKGCIHDGYLAFPYLNADYVNPKFLYYFFQVFQEEFKRRAYGMAQLNLNTGIVKNAEFPLPPIEEQKRIVAKVDQLMALCDQLESQIKKAQSTQQKLTEATVKSLAA